MEEGKSGIVAIIAACTIWGLSPLFYKLLNHVPPFELFLHRAVWSLVIFAGLLVVQRRLKALKPAFASPRAAALTAFCGAMVSVNWFLLIWSVQAGRVTETSLGYYMLPLMSVLLGTVWLGERLTRLQWLAVALAATGVAVLAVGRGTPPWLSLALAVSFGLYGLVKKGIATGPVASVTAECLVVGPLALAGLAWFALHGQASFGQDVSTSVLLMLSGLLTALPLILFSRAAQRVRLATLGIVQYLNPTLQFLCAVVVFAEPFGPIHAVTFGLIWVALALYSGAALRQDRARRRMVMASSAVPAVCTKSSSEPSANP
ncbi:EamA family transporter RarD [Thetidibacter halocola]|uniref:EamA family transporter RarD n=1 Tax=Thetidibacter halocola TaxID=2827239 RepID=A0A8J7WFJ8_9RHOB|nr:EamA family transporter RarD [Thetidibacter halocola]MBS0124138.1 EamA family transporter RarD [Thetidibacter halocola]